MTRDAEGSLGSKGDGSLLGSRGDGGLLGIGGGGKIGVCEAVGEMGFCMVEIDNEHRTLEDDDRGSGGEEETWIC